VSDRSRAQVRHGADVQDDAAVADLPHEGRVLDSSDPVADTNGAERLDGSPNGSWAHHLSGVWDRTESPFAGGAEGRLEGLRWIQCLLPAQTDTHDATIAILDGVLHHLSCFFDGSAAGDVGRETYFDAVALLGLLGAVAVAGEDLVPVDAPRGPFDRREDPFDVHRAVPGSLAGVVDDELTEVVGVSQRVRDEDPDVDELIEVTELVQLSETLDGVDRQGYPLRRAMPRRRSGRRVASRWT
jgi:hypothetical protein